MLSHVLSCAEAIQAPETTVNNARPNAEKFAKSDIRICPYKLAATSDRATPKLSGLETMPTTGSTMVPQCARTSAASVGLYPTDSSWQASQFPIQSLEPLANV